MAARVTVIVPLYNKAAWVGRALESIKAQTFDDLEVLIIDDGSTDGSGDAASAIRDPRFRVLQQQNSGPGAARNRGLALARSEFVAFLDADDEWLPNYVESAVARLSRTDVAAVASCYYEWPSGRPTADMWRRRGLREGSFRAAPATSASVFLHAVAFLTPCTTVTRTEVMRKWGGFYCEEGCRYAEDAFLFLKVLLNESVYLDLEPRVRIHREAAGLSKNLRGPRQLEPFLAHPDQVREACPPELRPLLDSFLTIRAFKTACVWGSYGKWREARELRSRFRSENDLGLPYYWPAVMCSSRLAAVGAFLRRI